MSGFVLEALKRYLVIQLIENTSMQSSTNTMSDINKNALQTAETMKGISEMFGSRTAPPPQQSPIVDPFGQTQQQGFTNPFEPQQEPGYSNEQVIALVSDMQKQLIEIQKQIFDRLHAIYNALKEITIHHQSVNQDSRIDDTPIGKGIS